MIRTLFAVLALAAALPARTAHADLPEVQQRGSLRVLVMIDTRRPEFFTLNAGTPGFDREVLQGFAQLHHVKLAPVPVRGWDALIPALLEGTGDLVAGRFTVTESRRKVVAFTTEVFPFLGPPTSLAYAVRKGDVALLDSLNDYIANLRRTPTWSRLVVDYFGASALEVLKKARE